MPRRLLLLLDGIAPDAAAIDSALWLVDRQGASLSVMLSLDKGSVTAPAATALGGLASAEHRDAEVLRRLEDRRRDAQIRVERRLTEAGVAAEIGMIDGERASELPPLVHASHLTIVSHGLRGDRDSEAIERDLALDPRALLGDIGRPMLLVDDRALGDGPAVVADDGGVVAARALASALQLGLLDGRAVHLVNVAETRDEAHRLLRPAASLCAAHGLEVQAHGEVGDPGAIILGSVEALGPALVIMGAYGERSLKTWLFGSTTNELLDRCAPPIFIQA